jgi:hypothetical protein
LALEIPTVRVVKEAPTAFDVTIPEGVRVTLDASDAPWGASQPWEVDIPLEVAGYRMHFTEARLEELNGTTLLVLSSAPYRVQDDTHTLFGLEMRAVHAPDGRDVDLESAHSSAGPQKEEGALHQISLAFDVVAPGVDGCTALGVDVPLHVIRHRISSLSLPQPPRRQPALPLPPVGDVDAHQRLPALAMTRNLEVQQLVTEDVVHQRAGHA